MTGLEKVIDTLKMAVDELSLMLGTDGLIKALSDASNIVSDELDYQKYLEGRRVRGTLAGSVVMSAEQAIEHATKEDYIRQQIHLKKMANNPILSDDARSVLCSAISNINVLMFYKTEYLKLKKSMEEKEK